jgi:tubulin--tyrosine ligase
MVDSNNHLWLIEVNTNPCLELSNKWLSCIIPRMLDDAFRLTIDKVFPPKNRGREEKNRYSVQGYSDEANMWEILSEDESEKIPTVE